MRKVLLSLTLVVSVFCPISAQEQLEITEYPFVYSYTHPSPSFENNFMYNQHVSFSIRKTDIYKKLNVKNLVVYDSRNTACFEASFDTLGKVLETKTKGMRYWISYKEERPSNLEYNRVIKYYENEVWMRTDSVLIEYFKYSNADTAMHYQKTTTYKFYKGSLINEQNTYHNERYLKVKISRENEFMSLSLEGEHSKGKVYLKKSLATDYQEDKRYEYSKTAVTGGFYGSVGKLDLPLNDVKDHRFMKSYFNDASSEFFVEGSDFEEPRWQEESMWCGNSIFNQQHYYDGRVSGTSYLDNGLIKELWEDYYPEDPNPTPREKEEDEDPNVLRIEDVQEGWVPRLDTPVRTVKYRLEYEYF